MSGKVDKLSGELATAVEEFMKPFFVWINPVLHSAVWQGRRWAENQIIVVRAVERSGPLTPSSLSRAFSLQKGSLTTIIRSLLREGILDRRDRTGDERSYELVVTDRGRALVRHLDEQRVQAFRDLFWEMPSPEIRSATAGLRAISAYLETKGEP